MKALLVIVAIFIVSSCSPQFDFKSSNWGDSRAKVSKTYSDDFNLKLSIGMLSFDQLILGKKASISFLFDNKKLVSGFTLFEALSLQDTKLVYDTMKKQFAERFGEEIFNENPQKLEEMSFNQIIWSDDETTVSMRLDEGRLMIKYFDKQKMPVD